MKIVVKRIPFVGSFARNINRKWVNPSSGSFAGSRMYWIERYESGRNSGDGSSGMLAEFKAEIINRFVLEHHLTTVIEYGCGDGNQLKLADYPLYTGFDVSLTAVSICKEIFVNDVTKKFKEMDDYDNETAALTLSLDVIYHLIEDLVYFNYMNRLFDSAERFVVIYSSDSEEKTKGQVAHIRHRNFTKWVEKMKQDWSLISHIPNRYPYLDDTKTGSFSEFFIYERV